MAAARRPGSVPAPIADVVPARLARLARLAPFAPSGPLAGVALSLLVAVGLAVAPSRAPAAGQEPTRAPSVKPPPGSRIAPPTTVGAIRFASIRIVPGRRFGGLANATNTGRRYLNKLSIGWSIVDRRGRQLDHGSAAIASLAPGETTTIRLVGSRAYTRAWVAVRFSVSGIR